MDQLARDNTDLAAIDDIAFNRAALGAEIRKLRKARSKRLAEIALATGRSVSFISQLERGNAEISISELRRIAQALGVPLGWFFVSESKPTGEVGRIVRASGRRRSGGATEGLVEELLSPNIGGAFEAFLSTFAAGASLPEAVLRETEEEGYVVRGQLNIWIGGNHFEVSAGDSFRIAREEFRWANRGDVDSVVVWVFTTPTH